MQVPPTHSFLDSSNKVLKGLRQYNTKCRCTHIHKCIQKHTQFAQKQREKTNTYSHSLPISQRCCLCRGLFVKPVESSLWNAKTIDFSLLSFASFPPPFLFQLPILLTETLDFVGFERKRERPRVVEEEVW